MRKNILITGASSGLGEGMARIFAANGHNLALCARRTDRLAALKQELVGKNPNIEVRTYQLDVNDPIQVFAVFNQAISELGQIDRVIVNAGLGKGGRIGTGKFEANQQTIQTNVIGALAQSEAAMEHFYERGSGHLVMISSMSAMRGMPSSMTTYAATKAMVAHMAEGIRSDLIGRKKHDIKVTTIYPGYIASEMNAGVEQEVRMMVDTETGCKALVAAIEREPVSAEVPNWPWKFIGFVLRNAPLSIVRKMV